MKKSKLILLCMLSGILLGLPWYDWFSGIILFVALVPLLFVENYIFHKRNDFKRGALVRYSSLTFLLWCAMSGWWVKNASFVGMIFIMLTNCLLLTLTFWLFHFTKRHLGAKMGYFSLIVYWLAYEYFFLNAEISFPWIILGNGFAKDIKLVQWYEVTGTLGGTLWILLINILIYAIISSFIKHRSFKPKMVEMVLLFLLIAIPITGSLIRFSTYQEPGNPVTIVVIQPNVDPYEKFINYSPKLQTDLLIKNAQDLIDEKVDYLVAPETAITNYADLNNLGADESIRELQAFIAPYPGTKFVLGIFARKYYYSMEDATETASPYGSSGIYYDTYNTAIQLDSIGIIQFYHKSLLVVGVEKMPYPDKLKFLKKLTIRLGGTFRSLATQKERTNLVSPDSTIWVGPIICWENVFGEYVTEYVKNGANLLFVITNEGWWKDTPGYKTLNHYSQLRAIETRRGIARSANTGITSFINQKGEVLKMIGWWKEGAIKTQLNYNNHLTFYVKHGDYLGRIACIFAILIALMALVGYIIGRAKK